MNLFKKKPSGLLYIIPQSDPFDGKRIKLATYKDRQAEEGLKKIRTHYPIKSLQICKIPEYEGLAIYADGNKAGVIWRDSWSGLYDKVKNHRISKAFLSVSDDVYLFID